MGWIWSRESVVARVTRVRTGRSGVRMPKTTRDFSLLRNDQITFGYKQPVIEWSPCFYARDKAAGSWSWWLTPTWLRGLYLWSPYMSSWRGQGQVRRFYGSSLGVIITKLWGASWFPLGTAGKCWEKIQGSAVTASFHISPVHHPLLPYHSVLRSRTYVHRR